ncbi:MAG: thioredoxin family protein [Chitinophagales bacterium]
MIIKKILAFIFIFSCAINFLQAQQRSVIDSAFSIAAEKNKNVLLIFSGSDWCAQCIRFEKKFLNDPGFIQFVDSNLVLITADFPQAKKQSSEIKKQNEELAERYNPSGKFPLILLLSPNRSVLGELDYRNENPAEFIAMINRYSP